MKRAEIAWVAWVVCLAACQRDGSSRPPEQVASTTAEVPDVDAVTPARYLLMSGVGLSGDDGAPSERTGDFVILDGRRAVISRGVIDRVLGDPADLVGFRSIPASSGGGYVLWSADRTYYADAFDGELGSIASVGAVGGARPWLNGMLLRTREGLYAFDVEARKVTRASMPAVIDAMALGGRRGVRLDPWGRVAFTVDGSTWKLPAGSVRATELWEQHGGILVSSDTPLWLGPESVELEPPPVSPSSQAVDPMALPAAEPPFASESARWAAFAGAILGPGRVLAIVEGSALVLDQTSAEPLRRVADRISAPGRGSCQPSRMGDDLLIACTHERGAHVIRLEPGDAESARLEATFPGPGAFFAAGDVGLAYEGRCGSVSPSGSDFAPGDPAPPEPAPTNDAAIDGPDPEDGWLCTRIARDRWVEHRLTGPAAAHLYRWIPAPDGEAVAIVVASKGDRIGEARPEGVRVVRVDPSRLEAGGLPDRRTGPQTIRQIEDDFWIDEAGALRGWIELGVSPADETLGRGPIPRMLPVVPVSGGPAAGITIGVDGRIEVHRAPEGVYAVVRGGRFGLAMGRVGDAQAAYETTDGGRSWRRVTAPVTGGPTEGSLDPDQIGCTAVGCSWGSGVVRWGWGDGAAGSAPAPPVATAATAARSADSRHETRIELACGGARPGGSLASTSDAHLVRGSLRQGFSGQVVEPFLPDGRRRPVRGSFGEGAEALALLPRRFEDPFGVAIRQGDGRLVAPEPIDAKMLPGFPGATIAEIGGSVAAAYMPRGGVLAVVRGDEVAELARWPLVSDFRASRTALARANDGRLGIAGYSVSSGDAWVAPLDMGAIDLGPAIALGSLADLSADGEEECATPAGLRWRFIASLPVRLEAGEAEPVEVSDALVLVSGSPDAMCVEGLELALDASVLVARFKGAGGAAWFMGGARTATSCELVLRP